MIFLIIALRFLRMNEIAILAHLSKRFLKFPLSVKLPVKLLMN